MLEINSLTKKYGDFTAVNNLSLTIKEGEICAFIGHNGAGKTTAIKCIVGILEPNEGQISIDGISLKTSPMKYKEKIAYIPDNPEVYDFMRGNEYLNFIADVYNVPQTKRVELINKYAEIFELKEVLGNYVSSYSHGMKQKLIVISALIHTPRILILDEPFVGLDPKATYILKNLMKEFCKEGGSIFFSTHILDTAEKLCDSVAIIKEGKIIMRGKMEDVKKDKSLEQLFLETEK